MRHLTISVLLLLAALAAAPVAGALDAAGYIAAAPPLDAFPDDDMVVLYRAETITVDDAGHLTRRVQSLVRLQTQWAVRSHSDVRVAWDSSRQDLEVVTARTFMRDGTVVPTPANGFNEVTPRSVGRAAVFLNWREMVISHVGTEVGCVVELEYVLRDRRGGALPTSGVFWFGGAHPVVESRVTVDGAMAMAANADGVQHDEAGATWTARDLPAYRDDGPAAHRARYVPHLAWSRIAGAKGLATSLRRHHEATAVMGPGLEAWLAETRDDPSVLTDADLVRRIAELIHDGTSGVHLPDGPWAAAPRPAEDVFATALGTDWERTIVAMTLLRAAGWQPELGLFGQAELVDGQPVVADRFPHLRVVVRVGDENWWLAPERAEPWTGGSDLPGWTGLFLGTGSDHRVYTVPERPGDCRWSAHLSPAPEGGWNATGDLVLRGPYCPRDLDADDLADRFAALLLPDAEIGDVVVREDSPGVVSLRLTAHGETLGGPDSGPDSEPDGDLLIRDLPWPDGSVLAHLPAGFHVERPARTAPLWIETPGREEVSLRIDLPDGWRLDAPADVDLTLSAPTASFSQQVRRQDGALVIERSLELAAGEIAPADYAAWREVLVAAVTADQQSVILLRTE